MMTYRIARLLLLWCALLSAALIYFEQDDLFPSHPTTRPVLRDTYSLLSVPASGETLFGLQSVQRVVNSAYAYEQSLLCGGHDYNQAVADIDDILPYAAQEPVRLPGYSTDHYASYGSVYVTGSGTAQEWGTPNGGCMTFLHMSQINTGTAVTAPLPILVSAVPAPLNDGQATALAVAGVQMVRTGAATYPGGFIVGHSGWPSSYAASNYSCGSYTACESDAHLCVVMDQAAANWLYAIVSGQHHKPKPKPAPKPKFPQAAWDHWRVTHHHTKISPYSKGHHLGTTAVLWWHGHVKQAGGIVKAERYTKPKRGAGYMSVLFVYRTLTWWPGHPKWVKWTRR